MKKLALLTAVAALALVFGLGPAVAEGIFEAPFVANAGAEVDGSEGKIERDGDYKVEIEPVTPSTTFEICLVDVNLGTVFLRDEDSDADGELKVDSDLNSDAAATFPAATTVTLQAPRFQVRDDAVVAGTCDGGTNLCTAPAANVGNACNVDADCDLADQCVGQLQFESGMDVDTP